MAGVSFTYNSRRYLGQTVFIKRGEHQGQVGQVVRELDNEQFLVALAEPRTQPATFHRSDFIVHRHRKLRVPAERN